MDLSYKTILLALPNPLLVCSREGKILFVNPSANQIFGDLDDQMIRQIIPALNDSEQAEDWFNQENERVFETYIKNTLEPITWKCKITDQDVIQSLILLFPLVSHAVVRGQKKPDFSVFKANTKLNKNETETLFRKLYHKAPLGITLIDSTTKRFADCNPMMTKILGYSKAELQQLTYFDITPKRFHQLDRIQTEALYISGQFGPYEKEYFHKDGHPVTVILHGESFFKDNGERMVWLYIQDISQQKEMGIKLKDSLNSVRILFDEAPEAYLLTDIKGHLIDANAAAEQLFGLSKSNFIGKNLLHLSQLPLSEVPKVASVLAQHAMGKASKPYELLLQRDEIKVMILEIRTFNVTMGEKIRLLTIAREITDRKNYEQQIINEKNKAQQYLDIAGSVIIGIKPDHSISIVNQAGCRLVGFEKPELIGQQWTTLLKTDHETEKIKHFLDHCFNEAKSPDEAVESKLGLLNGKTINFLWKTTLIYKDDGNIDGLLASGIDITELKRVQQLLVEKEIKSSHLSQISQLAMQPQTDKKHWIKLAESLKELMQSDECYITAWDEANHLAVPIAAHEGMFDQFIKLDANSKQETFTQNVLEEGKAIVVSDRSKFPNDNKLFPNQFDAKSYVGIPMIVGEEKLGAIIFGYLNNHQFTDDELEWGSFAANHLALAFHKSKLIEELRKSNATKDRFFSVLSHDLKSPFAGIETLTGILLENYPPANEADQLSMLKTLHETVIQLNTLIDQLLSWNRLERGLMPLNPEQLVLNDLVDEVCTLLKNEAEAKNIILQTIIPDNTIIEADERMLQSVLRNICQNAIKFTYPNQKIWITAKSDAEKIEIQIKDKGIGISKEAVQNLFELGSPKSAIGTSGEKGTGLGLLIAHEFIKLHQGHIQVESEPDKGSTFIIILPKHATLLI
jgi:PAS domain S-box-containing protein